MAFKRRSMSGKKSRKNFRKKARVHKKNVTRPVFRGGIRL